MRNVLIISVYKKHLRLSSQINADPTNNKLYLYEKTNTTFFVAANVQLIH